ncbi:hypothetical protein VTJ04DRAFT_5019 [Mycothermus thermophilus]|uniref:uncharacterized protein n=1 Tax=Humicola insolens TaxID=85995 RepID=UPI00374255ED
MGIIDKITGHSDNKTQDQTLGTGTSTGTTHHHQPSKLDSGASGSRPHWQQHQNKLDPTTNTHGSGLTGTHGSSGLTGSHGSGITGSHGSGLTGDHHGSSLTGNTGSGLTGTHHGSSKKPNVVEKGVDWVEEKVLKKDPQTHTSSSGHRNIPGENISGNRGY